jgi:hypothetical protein
MRVCRAVRMKNALALNPRTITSAKDDSWRGNNAAVEDGVNLIVGRPDKPLDVALGMALGTGTAHFEDAGKGPKPPAA